MKMLQIYYCVPLNVLYAKKLGIVLWMFPVVYVGQICGSGTKMRTLAPSCKFVSTVTFDLVCRVKWKGLIGL